MQLSSYRGNILFRTTPETHRELSPRAQESDVSLNQYLALVVQRGLAYPPEVTLLVDGRF
jgi:predicted HicB family RNase H-like nuclease